MLHLFRSSLPRRTAVVVFLAVFPLSMCVSAQQSSNQQDPANASASLRPVGNVEDWSDLTLAKSELHATDPLLGQKDDLDHFTRELWSVKWRQGDPIDLYVIKPKGVEKPPVVLYLYSFPSETDRFRDNAYCERITAGGFAAVGFVSSMTGQRYSNRPMKQWFVSELQESLASTVHDVQMVLNYLATRNDLDLTKVGMFGQGSGGTIAILAASVEPRLKAIDVLDPWGDWPDWLAGSAMVKDEERASFLTPEFLSKVAPVDPVRYLPDLKQKIRILNVVDDDVTPRAAADKINAAAPKSAELVDFKDRKEFFQTVGGGRIFEWVKDELRPPAPAAPNAARKTQPQTQMPRVEGGNEN
ncbi:MAG TPA: CocE/NonD family hydrolase [Terriglobales bacterium]